MTLLFPTNNVFGEEPGSDEEKGKGIVVQVEERGDVKSSSEKSCSANNSEIFQDCLKISHDRGLPLINHCISLLSFTCSGCQRGIPKILILFLL